MKSFLSRIRRHASTRWRALAAAALALALTLGGAAAHAQAMDEVRLVGDGNDAILQIRFNVRIQYQRHAPLAASDLIEIYFQLLGGDEQLTRPIEETLGVAAKAPAPGATVVYPVQNNLPVKKIVVRLDRKVEFRVRAGANNQLLEIVLPGLAPAEGAPQRIVSPVVEKDRYAISLQTLPQAEQGNVRAIPARLQNYDIFGSQSVRNGVAYYELVLGYFDSQADAEKVLATVVQDFPGAQVFDVVARKEANLETAAQNPPPPAPAAPEPEAPSAAAVAAAQVAAAPDTEVDKQGADLMAKARTALVGGKNDEALNLLNQLLLLPPNKYSQDAQELVGVARERSGDIAGALKEYNLYLKLFPSGDGATRVRQRLATLEPPLEAKAEAAKPAEKKAPRASMGGSLAAYYYGGKQLVQSVFNAAAINVNQTQQQITTTNQSSLAVTADLNGRYRTDGSDTRIVVRDSYQDSFLKPTVPSINRLDAAYVDYRDLAHGFSIKAGQQSGVTGGLVGRYLGAQLTYDLNPKLRVNAVAGQPVAQDEFVDAHQRFEGLSLEAQNLYDHWGGSAFLINQTADGYVDRRAVGGELRYFDTRKTLYSLIDYDVEFRAVNAATLQGTYQFEDQTSLSLLLDDRKAPTLTTSNGLLQAGCTSYAQFFAGQCANSLSVTPTIAVLRQDAEATTANTHLFAFDVSRPLNDHWQVSGDLRVSAVGALPTVTLNGQTFQGTSATGNVFGVTAQATGSNLYSKRDINVFSATRLHSATLSGTQFSYNNLNGLYNNRLTLSPTISWYHETDSNGQRLTRISPGLRSSWQATQRLNLDGTVAMERSANEGPTQNDTTRNLFYYVGMRYDLNF